MATITGFIEKIKFRNEDNGYTVLSVTDQSDGEEVIMVGKLAYAAEGDMIEASGVMTEHPVYGQQLQIETCEMKLPQDEQSVECYLGSGAIKGVGAALAARIVRRFKADTLRIMEEEPERLAEIKGISEKMAMAIGEQIEAKKDMRQAMMFLQNYGISMNLAAKIYQEYGPALYGIVRENPYRLADDIPGVGFKMADEIAQKVGIFTDSDYRIKAGLLYTLLLAAGAGHTYLPKEELLSQTAQLLKVEPAAMEKHLMDMQIERKIVIKSADSLLVYASQYYYLELNTARMLHDLNIRGRSSQEEIRAALSRLEEAEGIALDPLQEQAVFEAVGSGLLVITGGPGTGKTTTINTIIRYFEEEGLEILLAAPTGRAAKRMSEATGHEARTIHRMLELSGSVPEEGRRASFERNEDNPLEADVIIVDEMSMVDISLFHALLKAVSPGTRLILVGDVNQLPSVGPGQVLHDLIVSEAFPVVRLQKIFRQAGESDIVVNAHRINRGEEIRLDNKSRDFFFLERDSVPVIYKHMVQLIAEKLPPYVKATPYDIQVLTPMRKGNLGVETLNRILQGQLNPPDDSKRETVLGDTLYREGDKVMQTKNDYQLEWEVVSRYGIPVDRGIGVFNGDMGIIRRIDEYERTVTVEYDEHRRVTYSFPQMEEVELAYAITIHKSQGSEYPAVILPLMGGPRMLFNRNLLYTGVTRARDCVTILGNRQVVREMIANESEAKRYTSLDRRIRELKGEVCSR